MLHHRILRLVALFVVRLLYRGVSVTGAENLSRPEATILVANHPNRAIDAIVVAAICTRSVYFPTRHTVTHRNLLFSVLFRILPTITMYRGKESKGRGVLRNVDSLRDAVKVMKQGAMVCFFAEGTSHDRLKMYRFRSGFARLAAYWCVEAPEPLRIVPVAIEYERKCIWRTRVAVRIGEAMIATEPLQRQQVQRLRGDTQMAVERLCLRTRAGARQRHVADALIATRCHCFFSPATIDCRDDLASRLAEFVEATPPAGRALREPSTLCHTLLVASLIACLLPILTLAAVVHGLAIAVAFASVKRRRLRPASVMVNLLEAGVAAMSMLWAMEIGLAILLGCWPLGSIALGILLPLSLLCSVMCLDLLLSIMDRLRIGHDLKSAAALRLAAAICWPPRSKTADVAVARLIRDAFTTITGDYLWALSSHY